jgi:hypothetical protein
MPGWLWPRYTKLNPTFGVRLGRLLHYLGLAWAVACVAFGVFTATGAMAGYPDAQESALVATTLLGLLGYLAGRAARWLFAAE